MEGSTNLTSTTECRNHIILTTRALQDGFLFVFTESTPFSPTSILKRVKTTVNVWEKPCIFCNQLKYLGDTNRYRVSEVNNSKTLLKAANSNKDSVNTQCILFKKVGDVFAANVMYHSNCLNKYCYDVNCLMAFTIENDKDRWSGIS